MIMGRGIVGDIITSLILFYGLISQLVPDCFTECIELWQERLKNYFFPSIRIIFNEFNSSLCHRSIAYIAIEYYLSSKSVARVTKLKAESLKRKGPLLFSSDDYEDVEDEFEGVKVTCGERIIVFTTNHVDKLDPALIRRGRMDMHIELSYCTLGGFKVLAKNYLNLDSHPLFEKIGNLLEEVNMTPAEVSEHLICGRVGRDPKACLESLIEALETAKEKKINE
ncbi:P-loop containing nucleoside triphosphate hydrolases superfamily protein [Theobroma cacao]|uniref:P-loop containing nucleoside triphosphate hydrolases superfamily protein n=1 Tax=Theobroma cacao TaxID=3641 RepID=A0A061F323_THECC|nr:P-loop containing nucleoside triphosphate hydrolases superfamily protein [Theobroma cacao]